MCQKQTILALERAGRYIAQCEHGTIHIIWDNLTIRLRPADFDQFAGMVENAYARIQSQSSPNGVFRLRMRGVLLEFPPEDLELLEELTCLATVQMNRHGAADEINLFDLPEMESTYTHESPLPCSRN